MQPQDNASERNGTPGPDGRRLAPTLFWIGLGIGVAAIGAAFAYAALRAASAQQRADPTTQRIQELIAEANTLLKALDEQRHSA